MGLFRRKAAGKPPAHKTDLYVEIVQLDVKQFEWSLHAPHRPWIDLGVERTLDAAKRKGRDALTRYLDQMAVQGRTWTISAAELSGER